MKDNLILWLAFVALMAGSLSGCSSRVSEFYIEDDFQTVKKIDVHFHYETLDDRYLLLADSLNFRLVSPNVDAGRSISEQLDIATELKNRYPDKFAFFGTFGVNHYGSDDFAGRIISRVDTCMASGASGIKIWKNIGMTLKDQDGKYVMADDPAFAPVFAYMEENGIRLLAHLGEPKNCWLPLEEMTLDNDRNYFSNNPQYHMYLHPEAPSHEDQIGARDNLLVRYPGIPFTGAHLGSQEWSIDEVAKTLDKFPSYDVEFSARIGHLQYQAITEPGKVRDFMIKYQDRIMYGTDVGVSARNSNYAATAESLVKRWKDHFIWLATDEAVIVDDLDGKPVKGLQLPKEVIDKIYFANAEKFFR